MTEKLNPTQYIRKTVFGLTQRQFAEKLGVTQGSVADWEKTGFITVGFHQKVRDLARREGVDWSNRFFVETPQGVTADGKLPVRPGRIPLNPAQHIRVNVFGLTQTAFAREIGVNQGTVSLWEVDGLIRVEHHERVRALARRRSIDWDNVWFMETPEGVTVDQKIGRPTKSAKKRKARDRLLKPAEPDLSDDLLLEPPMDEFEEPVSLRDLL